MTVFWRLHVTGALLFLFIPLVLFLLLRFPLGVVPSIVVALLIIPAHRLVARPFFLRNLHARCLWCGRTSRERRLLKVQSGRDQINADVCKAFCERPIRQFFNFAAKYRAVIAAGIFLPLVWYVISTLMIGMELLQFPIEWNRFIFRFFIAVTVVTVSFAYLAAKPADSARFFFPIHNLFLLGIRNTLIVFRVVGIWWIVASVWFLVQQAQR